MNIAVNILYFLLFIYIGKKSFRYLLIIFIYIVPCQFGNMIGNYYPPPNPLYSLLISTIYIGIESNKLFVNSIVSKNAITYIFYGICTSIIGYVILNEEFTSLWEQSPTQRALRLTIYETLFIMVPILFNNYFYKNNHIVKSIANHVIYSGLIYTSLAIIQYLIFMSFNYDIFRVIRDPNAGLSIQSFFDIDGQSRVTSLIGEPRYLANFTSFWIFFLFLSWNYINIVISKKKWIMLCYFLALVLTGSRSGIVSYGFILLILLIAKKIIFKNNISNIFWISSIFVSPFLILLSRLITRDNLGTEEGYLINLVVFNSYSIDLEPVDYYSLKIFFQNIYHFIFGVGAGLYQYYFDPFKEFVVYKYFGDISTMDSWKSNIGFIFRLINYGLFGFILYLNIFISIYREYYVKMRYKINFGLLYTSIIIFISLLKSAELYSISLLPILIFLLFNNSNSGSNRI